jgi:hypothetical protein
LKGPALERFFVAYFIGATLGWIAGAVEPVLSESHPSSAALATYALGAGLVCALVRSLLALRLPALAARLGTVAVLGAFGALHLLYYANVKVLPGWNYRTWPSLALDAVILTMVIAPALWLARLPRAQVFRERWGHVAAAGGVLAATATLGLLVAHWPQPKATPERGGPGPNLLLIVLDSARRDRVAFASNPSPTSPTIDGWAKVGLVYDSAYAASSWTVPSVARILRTTAAGDPAERRLALPESLARSGYVSACFTDNPHLAGTSSIVHGFDHLERSVGPWRELLQGSLMAEVLERLDPGNDHDLADRALAWAKGRRGPMFIYAHLMDSHTPYRQAPIDGRRRTGRHIEFPYTGMPMTTDESQDVVARYEGGVRSADEQVGRLLEAAQGWGRPYLAIVTADHGESLGESGRWFHGAALWPELLAIPMVVVGTGVRPGRSSLPVGHDDIAPTLLAAAGTPEPSEADPDLRTQMGTGIVEGGLPPSVSYRIAGRYKIVVDHATGRRELFDLVADPREDTDVAELHPQLVERLGDGLRPYAPEVGTSAENLERLRALGYVGH